RSAAGSSIRNRLPAIGVRLIGDAGLATSLFSFTGNVSCSSLSLFEINRVVSRNAFHACSARSCVTSDGNDLPVSSLSEAYEMNKSDAAIGPIIFFRPFDALGLSDFPFLFPIELPPLENTILQTLQCRLIKIKLILICPPKLKRASPEARPLPLLPCRDSSSRNRKINLSDPGERIHVHDAPLQPDLLRPEVAHLTVFHQKSPAVTSRPLILADVQVFLSIPDAQQDQFAGLRLAQIFQSERDAGADRERRRVKIRLPVLLNFLPHNLPFCLW